MTNIQPLIVQLKLNNRLFANAIRDIDDQQGQKRISQHSNNISFIAIHLLGARQYLGSMLGTDIKYSFDGDLEGVTSIEKMVKYPPIIVLTAAWADSEKQLEDGFASLNADELKKKSPAKFPVDDDTLCGAISFLLHHEAYHIGQISFIRKILGLKAMSYG